MNNHTTPPIKTCTKCGAEYPATTEYWYKQAGGKYGLRAECKGCMNETHQRYCEANRDRVRETFRRWHEDNRDRVSESQRERNQRWYKANRDKHRENSKQWKQNNPDKVRFRNHLYRARKANAEGSHTTEELQAQYKRQKGRCYYCGCKLPKQGWHADHVIPLTKGGSDYISNIVASCTVCNSSKQNKLPHEWDGNGGRLL